MKSPPLSISPATQLTERRRNLRGQFQHRRRLLQQRLNPPRLAVAGGYHFGNLGDMALGEAVRRQLQKLGLNGELQTIYNLARWPKAQALIVGGGAVAYGSPLRALAEIYGDRPQNVAILGVDFNEPQAIEQTREFLSQVAMITVRSSAGAQRLRAALNRSDIGWHPDLAFSYFDAFEAAQPVAREPIFGLNAVPFFMVRRGNAWAPGSRFLSEIEREQPELLPHLDVLGERYCALLRAVVKRARAAKLRVVHFPFTPADEAFARSALGDLEIEMQPYSSDPWRCLTEFGRCQRVFTTRFHSLIFALVTRTPFCPFAYATKCDRLLDDLAVAPELRLGVADLLGDVEAAARRAVEGESPNIAWPQIEAMGREVGAAVARAAEKIGMEEVVRP